MQFIEYLCPGAVSMGVGSGSRFKIITLILKYRHKDNKRHGKTNEAGEKIACGRR